jgi:hypothetical protein
VPNNGWTQDGLTWNNQPAIGPTQSTTDVTTTPGYYFWDVTPFVREHLTPPPAGTPPVSPIVSFAIELAPVPGAASPLGFDIFGASPRPAAPPNTLPAPMLLISP